MAKTGLGYEQLDTAFRHRNFKPLYFLYGEETFLIDKLQQTLIEHALQSHERDFNLDVVYGAEAEASEVLGLCGGFPMMAERRVVIVRNFDELRDNRQFTEYARQPNPQAVVMLLCSGNPNVSAHPYRALRKNAAWGRFDPLKDREMPGWIQAHVEGLGRRIEPRAVQMLADYVGTDLRTAASEIDKLVTFAGERERLTTDDVVRASGQLREFNVFELQAAVGKGRYTDALRIADRMLQHAANAAGEGIMIVAVLNAYFAKLWKMLACQGLPRNEQAKRIGVSPYFISEYTQAIRRYDRAAIERAFDALLAADFELKGGAHRDARLVLTLLLRRLVPPHAS